MFMRWSRSEWSWAFYDWANSVYPLIVITAFFPEILGDHIGAAGIYYDKTVLLGYATSAAGLVVVLLAPVVGALSDQYGARRRFLVALASLGILATLSLSLIELGHPLRALFVFACGNIGYSAANGLYDALIVSVTRRDRMDRLSALGFSLGYAGSLILFMFGFLSAANPAWFGLPDKVAAIRLVFLLSALWWFVFTIPLLLANIEEQSAGVKSAGARQCLVAAFGELRAALNEIRQYRAAAVFLLAYWLYIDAVLTVVSMAQTYISGTIKDPVVPMTCILIVQVIAIPATLVYAGLAGRFGVRNMLMIGVFAYFVIISLAPFMYRPEHFYGLAIIVGMAQGGIQSLSRTMFARLIPESEAGKYFGFYNMVGKAAQLLGPFLMAAFAQAQGARLSILALLPLLLAGLVLLSRLPQPDG